MNKVLNFFKKPAIATFFTVLIGSLFLFFYWIPAAQEDFVQQNLWKSALITIAYFVGLRTGVQKRSEHLLYLLAALTVLAVILSGFIITSGYLTSDWKVSLRLLFSLSVFFLPSISVVSVILVLWLSKLNRKKKCWYYLKAGGIGLGLGVVAATLAVITLCFWCSLFGCSD